MQPTTPQEAFAKGLIKQRELKKTLQEKNNALASQNDQIMGERVTRRTELKKALSEYDTETRKLQLEADMETGYQKEVETFNKELQESNKSLAEKLEAINEAASFT